MATALEEPQRLKSEVERLKSKLLEQSSSIATRVETADRVSILWREYVVMKAAVDEQLALAKHQYKEVLKRTEAGALSGRPRLYWFAKVMFAKLRKHSLEYQVSEARMKLEALQQACEKLNELFRKLNLSNNAPDTTSLFDFEVSEELSAEHASAMKESWMWIDMLEQESSLLQKKFTELEVSAANTASLVAEVNTGVAVEETAQQKPRVVESAFMLRSRQAHIGFANKTKLAAQIEQCEYAADHAERDLQKVRDGLKMASEASLAGRATRATHEWLDYCRAIVGRYKEHQAEGTTLR